MKRIVLGTLATLALCSCGHNIGTAFYGKVFNVGYDPELNKFGIQYYDGAVVTGLQKEKANTNFEFADVVEGKDGVKTTSTLKYSTKTGDQITGYGVDAIKAAAELEKARQANGGPSQSESAE